MATCAAREPEQAASFKRCTPATSSVASTFPVNRRSSGESSVSRRDAAACASRPAARISSYSRTARAFLEGGDTVGFPFSRWRFRDALGAQRKLQLWVHLEELAAIATPFCSFLVGRNTELRGSLPQFRVSPDGECRT